MLAPVGSGFQLNPQFVGEMMGFPPDWTELPFLNGEVNQLKPTGTQSCHKELMRYSSVFLYLRGKEKKIINTVINYALSYEERTKGNWLYTVLAKRCGRLVRWQRLCRHEGRVTRGIASMPEAPLGRGGIATNEKVYA